MSLATQTPPVVAASGVEVVTVLRVDGNASRAAGSAEAAKQGLEKRPTLAHAGNSAWLTAGIIIADVVGAGVLSMPMAIAKFGWVLGGLLVVVLLAMNVHISIVLWRCKMHCPEATTYMELMDSAFKQAPKSHRIFMKWITGLSQYSFMIGVLGVYGLSWGKGFGMMAYEARVCMPVLILLGFALLAPFHGSARNMGSWQSLVWLNILTLLGAVVIPLAYMMAEGQASIMPEGSQVYAFAPLEVRQVFAGLGIMSFGFSSQFILTEVISEMKNPAELPKAYCAMSAPFQCAIFLLVGLTGYCYMGDKVKGMVIDSIPFGPVFQVASACLVTHMLISYLIKSVVVTKAFHNALDAANASLDTRRSWAGWNLCMLTVMVGAYLSANTIPFFADLVDLLGASVTPLSCYILPIFAYARVLFDTPSLKRKISKFEYLILILELQFSLLLIVVGTWASVQTIMDSWHTYGYPFECHCNDMWNTCACSADHAGMEYCMAPDMKPFGQ